MGSSAEKTLSISLPPDLLEELNRVRQREHRSRSEVLRDALRRYIEVAARTHTIPIEEALPEEIEAMRRADAEYERGECVRLEDLQRELGLRTR